jgi:hypothetical protein
MSVEGRDYHYGPHPAGGPTKHEGSRAACFYPDCDLTHREVSEHVRRYLREHHALSIVSVVHTGWHNGSRRTVIYPRWERARELEALVQDGSLKDLSRVVEWEDGHVVVWH